MMIVLLIIFACTLIYFFLSERVEKHINLLAVQGTLLFIIAFINLIEINLLGLILILLETLIVKAIIIPRFLNRIRRTNNLNRLVENYIPFFYSVLIITAIIIASFFTAYSIRNHFVDVKFLAIALSTILGGIYFTIVHKNIFNHIVGIMIIENGAFLLSLAVGGEFPFLVSMAVLIDILIAVLIIGIFIDKIGSAFGNMSTSSLNKLKD
jgi:hydrogenase-4 component E